MVNTLVWLRVYQSQRIPTMLIYKVQAILYDFFKYPYSVRNPRSIIHNVIKIHM